MWVRGLKLNRFLHQNGIFIVAPYVGAWIETQQNVRPFRVRVRRTLSGSAA